LAVLLRHGFLMYRVELKGQEYFHPRPASSCVPNVPCGVERSYSLISLLTNSCACS